jgi:transcription elongation factor GreB
MSKAFTREDDGDELPPPPKRSNPLPPGAKNYITVDGAKRLRQELEQCQQRRAQSAAGSDSAARKAELQKIDQHIAALQAVLDSAVVTFPPEKPWEEVRFGATVRVRDTAGEETAYRIVGVDETDIDRDWVSWLSPIARALLNARVGQRVRFRVPAGERELEILSIEYAAET